MIYTIVSYLMSVIPIVGFIFIISILFYWFIRKTLPTIFNLKFILYFFIGIIILQALILSFLNYFLWKHDPISYLLLPPYTPISYILHYSWQHYFATPIITIIFALIIFCGIKVLNKKFNNTFFYDEEPYLAALGMLATGWPNCLIYLTLVLFLGILFHFINYCLNGFARLLSRSYRSSAELGSAVKADRQNEMQRLRAAGARRPRFCEISEQTRLPLLYFWLPSALLILLFGDIISKYLGIIQLSI